MSDPLELENRRKIYRFVEKNPGVYMREIQRALSMPTGLLEYHLSYLVKRGMLSTYQDGRRKRYYSVQKVSAPDKHLLGVLRQKIPRRILIYCISQGSVGFSELLSLLNVSKSTLSFNLSKLLRMDIIDEIVKDGERFYSVRERERITELIITYRESYLDDLVDRFVDSFMNL